MPAEVVESRIHPFPTTSLRPSGASECVAPASGGDGQGQCGGGGVVGSGGTGAPGRDGGVDSGGAAVGGAGAGGTGGAKLICASGLADCNANQADGCETDLRTDPHACNACGRDCDGMPCTAGKCAPVVLNAGVQAETLRPWRSKGPLT